MQNRPTNVIAKTTLGNGPHFIHPKVTPEAQDAVIEQLHFSTSIYNRSGVIERFEEEFRTYHGMKFAVATNSGTSALHTMFWSAGLKEGDEVLCPTYTFFATVTPMLPLGLVPVFVDCDETGNIDPTLLKSAVTPRTKAIVVTHMWGIPCDMPAISNFAKRNNLILMEDCSHAHGAKVNGQLVGTWGKCSAWSLQGQKIITGGEAGILLTNDDEVYYNAQLVGHYNKRCLQEIPKENPLYQFALTGYGHKFRAHPLALALASQQFSHLDEWLKQKAIFASMMMDAVSGFDCIRPPSFESKSPSWYGLVFQYDASKANGVQRDKLVSLLHQRNLIEVDAPGSTKPIHDLPIFKDHAKYPFKKRNTLVSFDGLPVSKRFYEQAIKLPVWYDPLDKYIVEAYCEGLHNTIRSLQ